jgi:hypothetical protein
MGIRIYFGQDPTSGEKNVVLAAADAAGNDMTDLLLDRALPNPPFSGISNGLNS